MDQGDAIHERSTLDGLGRVFVDLDRLVALAKTLLKKEKLSKTSDFGYMVRFQLSFLTEIGSMLRRDAENHPRKN